jgi:hydrogenase-1 operon protein HyaE
VIFLPNNPQHYPETLDVAIVLPELVKVFQGQFKPAVADWDYAKVLAAEYAITEWPALLFLRYGEYLGCITRVRDWSVYLSKIKTLLAATPSKKPGIGVAVVSANTACQ